MGNKINKEPPFFSLVIPTLNEEKYLPNLLKDLSNQTFRDFEIIIVDAESEDKTVSEAYKFKSKVNKLEILTSNKKNVSFQRNMGALKSRADWIIFLDADSRIPHYFLQGIKFRIEFKDTDFLTSYITPDTKNKKDNTIAMMLNIYTDLQKSSRNPYILEAMLCTKKKSFLKLAGFDESIGVSEGNELLRRAVKEGMKFCVIKNPKYSYSFRRSRKEGLLKGIRSAAEVELKRLLKQKIPKDKAKYIYPMEGGGYFEIDNLGRSRLKKIFKMLVNIDPDTNKAGKRKFVKFLDKVTK